MKRCKEKVFSSFSLCLFTYSVDCSIKELNLKYVAEFLIFYLLIKKANFQIHFPED